MACFKLSEKLWARYGATKHSQPKLLFLQGSAKLSHWWGQVARLQRSNQLSAKPDRSLDLHRAAQGREDTSLHHHHGDPPFSFSGTEALWCMPFFLPDLRCMPFSLVFPGKWYTPWLFLLCEATAREKRGPTVVVYTLFSPALIPSTFGLRQIGA